MEDDAERIKAAHADHWGPVVAAGRATYTVRWSDKDGEHVGTCAEFPSLSWLGTRPEKALTGIMALVADTVGDLTAEGEPVPDPITDLAPIEEQRIVGPLQEWEAELLRGHPTDPWRRND